MRQSPTASTLLDIVYCINIVLSNAANSPTTTLRYPDTNTVQYLLL